jgi:hypothetical protein
MFNRSHIGAHFIFAAFKTIRAVTTFIDARFTLLNPADILLAALVGTAIRAAGLRVDTAAAAINLALSWTFRNACIHRAQRAIRSQCAVLAIVSTTLIRRPATAVHQRIAIVTFQRNANRLRIAFSTIPASILHAVDAMRATMLNAVHLTVAIVQMRPINTSFFAGTAKCLIASHTAIRSIRRTHVILEIKIVRRIIPCGNDLTRTQLDISRITTLANITRFFQRTPANHSHGTYQTKTTNFIPHNTSKKHCPHHNITKIILYLHDRNIYQCVAMSLKRRVTKRRFSDIRATKKSRYFAARRVVARLHCKIRGFALHWAMLSGFRPIRMALLYPIRKQPLGKHR